VQGLSGDLNDIAVHEGMIARGMRHARSAAGELPAAGLLTDWKTRWSTR
jgi:hypothetical protein